MNTNKTNKGIGMFEIVIGVGIIALAMVALIGGFRFFLSTGFAGVESIKARFLAEEGLEAVRALRDDNYEANIAQLTPGTDYFLTYSSGSWGTSTIASLIDGEYRRSIVTSAVNRDSNDDIVASGGTSDPDTTLITVEVAWNRKGATSTKEVSAYFTNLFKE